MKFKTTVAVSRTEEGKVAIIDKIVIGELTSNKVLNDTDGVQVGFKYTDENGIKLDSGAKTYSWDEVNALYDAIKSGKPNTTFKALMDYCFDNAFKIEMASTFGITTAQLTEV